MDETDEIPEKIMSWCRLLSIIGNLGVEYIKRGDSFTDSPLNILRHLVAKVDLEEHAQDRINKIVHTERNKAKLAILAESDAAL